MGAWAFRKSSEWKRATRRLVFCICWTYEALSQSAVKLHHHHTDEAVVDTQNSCGEGSPCPNKKTTSTKAKP